MTEQQISSAVDELISLVMAGKPMEAFEKFYHPNLEKTDLDGVKYKGKAINEKNGLELLSQITAVRDFSSAGKIVKGNRSFIVWSIDLDNKVNGLLKVNEVAIQDWEDGKIINERYFV